MIAPRLGLEFDYNLWRPQHAAFAVLLVDRDLRHLRSLHWNTGATALDAVGAYAIHSGRFAWGSAAVLDLEDDAGCHALVTLDDGVLRSYLAAATATALDAGEAFLRERLPEATASEDQKVPVTFWAYGRCGPDWSSRRIAVPVWADLRGNYPPVVADALDRLMDPAYRPATSGQLVLWHGPPGTGKTYALRALAWEWREWCSFHYVTDPDRLFGSASDYLVDLLLDDEEDERWRLLLLEDTGELLSADAKRQAGQGLSRLLNLCDGLIGQGLRVLVLITTNDDLRSFHPAVARPGRCAARVEFIPFTEAEAAEWLARNGVDGAARPGTLAHLFAAADGEPIPERRPVGFVW